jgi:hypothetical protein
MAMKTPNVKATVVKKPKTFCRRLRELCILRGCLRKDAREVGRVAVFRECRWHWQVAMWRDTLVMQEQWWLSLLTPDWAAALVMAGPR